MVAYNYNQLRIHSFLAEKVELADFCFFLENMIGSRYAFRWLAGSTEARSRTLVQKAARNEEIGEVVHCLFEYWLREECPNSPKAFIQTGLDEDLQVHLQELLDLKLEDKAARVSSLLEKTQRSRVPRVPSPSKRSGSGAGPRYEIWWVDTIVPCEIRFGEPFLVQLRFRRPQSGPRVKERSQQERDLSETAQICTLQTLLELNPVGKAQWQSTVKVKLESGSCIFDRPSKKVSLFADDRQPESQSPLHFIARAQKVGHGLLVIEIHRGKKVLGSTAHAIQVKEPWVDTALQSLSDRDEPVSVDQGSQGRVARKQAVETKSSLSPTDNTIEQYLAHDKTGLSRDTRPWSVMVIGAKHLSISMAVDTFEFDWKGIQTLEFWQEKFGQTRQEIESRLLPALYAFRPEAQDGKYEQILQVIVEKVKIGREKTDWIYANRQLDELHDHILQALEQTVDERSSLENLPDPQLIKLQLGMALTRTREEAQRRGEMPDLEINLQTCDRALREIDANSPYALALLLAYYQNLYQPLTTRVRAGRTTPIHEAMLRLGPASPNHS